MRLMMIIINIQIYFDMDDNNNNCCRIWIDLIKLSKNMLLYSVQTWLWRVWCYIIHRTWTFCWISKFIWSCSLFDFQQFADCCPRNRSNSAFLLNLIRSIQIQQQLLLLSAMSKYIWMLMVTIIRRIFDEHKCLYIMEFYVWHTKFDNVNW